MVLAMLFLSSYRLSFVLEVPDFTPVAVWLPSFVDQNLMHLIVRDLIYFHFND